jgi:RimJ/RimL family protein N-acetyltransferase
MGVTVTKIIKFISERGFLEFLKSGFRHLRIFVFSYRPLYLYGSPGATGVNLRPLCPMEIRKGNRNDINQIIQLLDYLDKSYVCRRTEKAFNDGAEPFLVFSGNKPVHISWLCHPPVAREELANIHLKPNEAHIAACYTHPDFRGKNIFPVVLQHILRYASEQKIDKVYIAVLPENAASRKGIEKAGFSKAATIKGFMLFGKMFNADWQSG